MARDQEEVFKADRLGNVRRELSEILSRVGSADESNNEGFITVGSGDLDTNLVAYEIPDDVQEFHLELIQAYDSAATNSTEFYVLEATLDSDGNITSTTRRSVTYTVAAGSNGTFEYHGKPFTGDAVAITSGFEGEISLGGYNVHNEYNEAASEQTST